MATRRDLNDDPMTDGEITTDKAANVGVVAPWQAQHTPGPGPRPKGTARRHPQRAYELPKVLTMDCATKCACPHPVARACGCVNHAGGEITYCPLHAAAPELLEALRDIAAGASGRGESISGEIARAAIRKATEP